MVWITAVCSVFYFLPSIRAISWYYRKASWCLRMRASAHSRLIFSMRRRVISASFLDRLPCPRAIPHGQGHPADARNLPWPWRHRVAQPHDDRRSVQVLRSVRPAQRYPIRDAITAPCRPGSRFAGRPARTLPAGTPVQPTTLERPDPRLDAGRGGHIYPHASPFQSILLRRRFCLLVRFLLPSLSKNLPSTVDVELTYPHLLISL